MRIIMYTEDQYKDDPRLPLGGTGYYRLELPAQYLRRKGHEVYIVPRLLQSKTGELAGQDFDGKVLYDAEVIVTQRWMYAGGAEKTQAAVDFGQVVIADLDDNYWALPTDNGAFYGTHPKVNPGMNRNHYRKQVAACSAVTVSTPALVDVVRRFNPNVYLVRNAIDPRVWWRRDPLEGGTAPRYGWTGGTLWRQTELAMLSGYVRPFFERHPELEFAHVGHRDELPAVRDLLKLPAHTVVYAQLQSPFCDFPMRCHESGLQVCLVPLQDNSFNHAKSALKGMEATAMGIPFITSTSPEYRNLGVGRIVKKPREWGRALEEMLDPQTRADYVAEATKRVEKEYIDVRGADWEDLYTELVG